MKVSPLLVRMMKLAVSVVDLDASSKGFAELHLAPAKLKRFGWGGIWNGGRPIARSCHC